MWLAFWLYVGVSMFLDTPNQIASDQNFVASEIKPSVDFVNTFKRTNGRLPNYREYYTWQRDFHEDYSSDLTQQVDSLIPGLGTIQYIRKLSDVISNDYDKFTNADWNKDFAIGVWRGEWTEYYFSWTNSYDTNNYSWADGYIGLAVMTGIGAFPFFILVVKHKTKKKKQHTTRTVQKNN